MTVTSKGTWQFHRELKKGSINQELKPETLNVAIAYLKPWYAFYPSSTCISLPRTMSNLYRDADWSRKDLDKQISEARKHMTKCKINSFSLEYLKYYKKQLCQRKREGRKTSFIDLWGLVLESFLHDGVQYIIKQHLLWLTIFWKFISKEKVFFCWLWEKQFMGLCKQIWSHFQNFGARLVDTHPWWKSAFLLVKFWICFSEKIPRLTFS